MAEALRPRGMEQYGLLRKAVQSAHWLKGLIPICIQVETEAAARKAIAKHPVRTQAY